MIAAARLRLAGALALLALGACSPIDTRSFLLIVDRQDRTEEQLRFWVKGSTGTVVEALIDGRPAGRFTTGHAATIDLRPVAEGFHTLRIEGRGARPADPVEARFELFRHLPAVVAVRPPPGLIPTQERLTIEVDFSEPLDPASVSPATTYLSFAGGRDPERTDPALSPDGRTLRLELDRPIPAFETLFIGSLGVTDLGGNPVDLASWPRQGWHVPSLDVDLGTAFPRYARGVVSLPATSRAADVPADLVVRLHANGTTVASFPYPLAGPLTWDTTTVPDGEYELTVRADQVAVSNQPVLLRVDNTPPVVTCRALRSRPGFAEAGECLAVSSTEGLDCRPLNLVPGGQVGSCTSLGPLQEQFACPFLPRPPAPYVEHLDLGEVTDAAGNPPTYVGCTRSVEAWAAPWGEGPLAPAGTALLADEVAVGSAAGNLFIPARRLVLAWVGSAGTPEALRVSAAVCEGATWAEPSLVSSASVPASGLAMGMTSNLDAHLGLASRLAWVERTAGGPGQIQTALLGTGGWSFDLPGPLNLDPSHDAGEPSVASVYGYHFGAAAIAWTEEDGGGQRALVLGSNHFLPWSAISGDLGAVSAPSVSYSEFDGLAVSYVETPATGPTQARRVGFQQLPSGAWGLVRSEPPLGVDPSAATGQPSTVVSLGTVRAWVEGGRVLARMAPSNGVLGDAVVLNADAARTARSPVAFHDDGRSGVAFIEETPSGDQIRVRVLEDGAWRLLAVPANAGVPGPVRQLRASSGFTSGIVLAWIDADGHVRARVGNY